MAPRALGPRSRNPGAPEATRTRGGRRRRSAGALGATGETSIRGQEAGIEALYCTDFALTWKLGLQSSGERRSKNRPRHTLSTMDNLTSLTLSWIGRRPGTHIASSVFAKMATRSENGGIYRKQHVLRVSFRFWAELAKDAERLRQRPKGRKPGAFPKKHDLDTFETLIWVCFDLFILFLGINSLSIGRDK